MMLTTLAEIARSAGLRVLEQPGWRSRGHGQMSGVRAVVCHHTAGARTGNAPSLGVVQNGRSDLAGPLAHFVLGRDGTVYVVAAGLCWHAGAVLTNAWSNNYSVGIEAEATGTDAWPPVQLDAYARLCRALCAAYGLPVSAVLGHKEVCTPKGRKTDPNFDMGAFRARVAALGTAPAGRGSTGGDDPHNQEDDMPDRKLDPTNGKDACETIVLPKTATEFVVSLGWVPLYVKKLAFFGPTKPSGLNQLSMPVGAGAPFRIDGGRSWQVAIPAGAVTAELTYSMAPDPHRETSAVAGCR